MLLLWSVGPQWHSDGSFERKVFSHVLFHAETMPQTGGETELADLKKKISDADAAHDELVKGLQAQYEESDTATKKVKTDAKPRMKVLRAALASAASANKDEV